MLTIRNKFDTLQKISERHILNDKYKNFTQAHKEAAAKCIQSKPRTKCRIPWESTTGKIT